MPVLGVLSAGLADEGEKKGTIMTRSKFLGLALGAVLYMIPKHRPFTLKREGGRVGT